MAEQGQTQTTEMTKIPTQTRYSSSEEKENSNENPLINQFIRLKNTENGDTVTYQIEAITTKVEERVEIPDLIKTSTNQWLFIEQCCQCTYNRLINSITNFSIAFMIIMLQLFAYGILSSFLISSYKSAKQIREDNCYGPNCRVQEQICMDLIGGIIAGLLLVGFLWADIISTFIMVRACFKGCTCMNVNCSQLMGSIIILVELASAIACAILVGLYTESQFDAINGAVGILFIHDLDEKIYSAVVIIDTHWKRILVLFGWIVLSFVIAMSCACTYQDGSWKGAFSLYGSEYWVCKDGQFNCGWGECIWAGYVCNGVRDCVSFHEWRDHEPLLDDEKQNCNFSVNYCPYGMFKCESDGLCIEVDKKCDGILDCHDGSDEARNQNCAALISNINCGNDETASTHAYMINKYSNNNWYKTITDGGYFKCDNGQCIDGKYMCDGITDCLDGSDEWPIFYRPNSWPNTKQCPYDRLIECENDEVLCKISGQCIHLMRLCDSIIDCPNGEDERECIRTSTTTDILCGLDYLQKEWFMCGSPIAMINESVIMFSDSAIEGLQTIEIEYINGTATVINESYTVSDFVFYEQIGRHTNDSVYLSDYVNQLNAFDFGCVPIASRCDGMKDCSDGSDEKYCDLYREMFGNPNEMFECEDKGIPKTWECDGFNDCGYWEDEEGCHSFVTYTVECNETVNGSITGNVGEFNYVLKECGHGSVTVRSCIGNDSSPFSRDLNVWYYDTMGSIKFRSNVGSCDDGSALPIVISDHSRNCNVNDSIYATINAQYPKEAFGDFSLEFVCE